MENMKITLHDAKEVDCANVLRAQLYRKVEKVANAIGALKKDGRNNSGRGFAFITHEAMTTALRPLLIIHSLSIVMDVVDVQERDLPANKNGVIAIRSTVKAVFTLTDTETGHQEERVFFGADQDFSGKSLQQAITQAQKYFFFKTFKVTDKESDGDYKSTQVSKQSPQKHSLEGLKSLLNHCNTDNAIIDLWKSIDAALIPDGFQEACKERKDKINEVTKYEQPSSDGKATYTQSFSIAGGWNCTCPSTSKNCKHIKASKVLS